MRGMGQVAEVAPGGGLFGRIAVKKGLVSEAQLGRALRLQEELRAVGLARPLGRVLVAEGILAEGQVELILRLQQVNERVRSGRRFGRVAVRNGLLAPAALERGLARCREEGYERGLEEVLLEQGALEPRAARAVQQALARHAARAHAEGGSGGASSGDDLGDPLESADLDEPAPGQARTTTGRLAQTLDTRDADDADPRDDPAGGAAARAALARRKDDLAFAAVALRAGLVLVGELERALEDQDRLPAPGEAAPALADVLRARGVLGPREVAEVLAQVAAAREERLVIPGYAVTDVLGHGVTSLVLRARHELIGHEVAIKLFRPEHVAATTPEGLLEEARQAGRVRHPNLVQVFEAGRVHRRVYLVMELVDGRTLTDRLRGQGPLPEREALALARDVARALTAVHAAGLVHRDVKPQNVLLAADGAAKLTDLGLACDPRRSADVPGAIYGSPHTISPEQAQGDPIDARADLYGLGATLFQALTEQPPYDANDALTILMAHVSAPVPDPRARRAGISRATAELVMRLLAKAPADRPPDAAAVVAALEALLAAS